MEPVLDAAREQMLGDLVDEFRRCLLEQLVVVERDQWLRYGASDAFVKQHLSDLFGARDWDTTKINGRWALRYVREINDTVHHLRRTSGGARYRSQVEESQGGAFCVACGRRDDLHVDHIVPVSRGGDEFSIRNMQLLCSTCNSAKRDLEGELLPSTVVTVRDRAARPRARFKRLLLTGLTHEGRKFGQCGCGRTSREAELYVFAQKPLAANFINLRVTCRTDERWCGGTD